MTHISVLRAITVQKVLTRLTHTNAPLARIIHFEGRNNYKIAKNALKVISVPLALFHPPIYAPQDTTAN